LAALVAHGVRRLVDIRRFPSSRRYPHFGGDALARALARAGVDYLHLPEMGEGGIRRRGLRPTPACAAPASVPTPTTC